MAQKDEHTREEHLQMFGSPNDWSVDTGGPNFNSLLPLTKRTPEELVYSKRVVCGYLVEGKGATVHLGNVFMPDATPETITYPSFAAIYDAGWRVD